MGFDYFSHDVAQAVVTTEFGSNFKAFCYENPTGLSLNCRTTQSTRKRIVASVVYKSDRGNSSTTLLEISLEAIASCKEYLCPMIVITRTRMIGNHLTSGNMLLPACKNLKKIVLQITNN